MSIQQLLGAKQQTIRSGQITVGNIGNTGVVVLPRTDSILTATKFTGYNDRDATVVLTYQNLGYTPLIFVSTIYNPIVDSRTNDLSIHTLQIVTASSCQLYLEKVNAGDVMGIILYVQLLKPESA